MTENRIGASIPPKIASLFAQAIFTAGALALLLLFAAGCSAPQSTWTWQDDDSLPALGDNGPYAEDAWSQKDGWIQLQLVGSSIPGQQIESITQSGSELTVKTKRSTSQMETMDIQLFEFRIEGGNPGSVKSVVIDRESGTNEATKID